MLSPPLDSIRAEILERFRAAVTQDDAASTFPDLLDVEEQLEAFLRLLGHQMMQAFVDERQLQAQASKPPCPSCHEPMEWLRRTHWHPHNVPGVLALRTLRANGWWEEYWSVQRTAWRQRAQSFRLRDEHRTQLPNAA